MATTFLRFSALFFALTACKPRINAANLQGATKPSLAEQLILDVRARKIPTFESFVNEALPQEMFSTSNYVLYGESNSMCADDVIQGYPRVVLLNKREDFFVAFNGNPNGDCFGTVEIIDMKREPYQFTLINFKEEERTFENHKDCSRCHSGTLDRKKLLVPIWKLSQVGSQFVKATWHIEAFAGATGFIVQQEEKDRFMEFINHKNEFPYKRLEGEYKPLRGKISDQAAFAKLPPGSLTVPFGKAFDHFDNYFTDPTFLYSHKLVKASHLEDRIYYRVEKP